MVKEKNIINGKLKFEGDFSIFFENDPFINYIHKNIL